MTILGGQILCSNSDGSAEIRRGVIKIEDDRIESVEFGAVSQNIDFGGEDALLCPGLIDTHLHLPQFDTIGVAGMRLLPWLENAIFPAEQKWNDLRYAKEMIQRVARQCLSVGTTGVCGYATVSHAATIAALTAFREIGFRGVIGQVMMDENAPPELLRPASQMADEVNQTLDLFPPAERMAAAVTPRFALSCSESLLELAGELAQQHRAVIQTHLAETLAECEAVRTQFGGKAYARVYDDASLLTDQSILGHGIYLDSDDQALLVDRGSVIAHCPTANSFLGSGMMNRRSHLGCGIPVTLGSDIGAGFERSMVRVGRSMIETALRIAVSRDIEIDDQEWIPSAAQAWHQITAGNADALGWDDAGRIRKGCVADLLVIRPDIEWRTSSCPLSTLMFAWDDRWIKQTFLCGRLVFRTDSNTDATTGQ